MEFVSMTCRNCGGKLQIFKESDQIICLNCGTEYLVKFNEGGVSIKLLSEGLKKIQVSTDKTASELALARIREEKASILFEIKRLRQASSQHGITLLEKVDWNNLEELMTLCEKALKEEKKSLFFSNKELVYDLENYEKNLRIFIPQYRELVAQERYHQEIVSKI